MRDRFTAREFERLKKMGKIVKYCNSCDGGYAEKFTFCPDCGAALQAFEMNPLAAQSEPVIPAEVTNVEARAADEPVFAPTEDAFGAAATAETIPQVEEISSVEQFTTADETDSDPYEVAAPVTGAGFYRREPMYADEPAASHYTAADDNGFNVTVIEGAHSKQRNVLLLGATFLMVVITVATTIGSLFNKAIGMDAIGDDRSIALLIDEVPMEVEEVKKEEKDKDSGGGGGGGREDKEETSQGDLADQSPTPTRPPDVKVHRANFELVTPPPQTEGDRKFEKKFDRWGDPNSKFLGLSNGPGTGGGQGTGNGTGQGSGNGTGTGSGNGSGSGSGDGTGNGAGSGAGSTRSGSSVPPPLAKGVTTAFRLIAKPKANYTDAARTNNVQGSVKLKVTLLASGSVGSITPVTRLPHGLTEQAIAAARQIRFEPKKVNGVAVPTIVTMEYTFTMY